MGIKEELKQYRFKVMRVNETLEEYEKFKDRAEKITSVMDGMSSKGNQVSDKIGNNVVMMVDIENEYISRWREAEFERIALMDKINRVGEPYRSILFKRYVQNKNFECIASEIGYSYKQILRLHRTFVDVD